MAMIEQYTKAAPLGAQSNSIQKVQPTVASALGSIETINERLAGISNHLTNIAVQVGGPFPANGIGDEVPAPNGIVDRLHYNTDRAHRSITEIEGLIGSISRALG